MSGGSFNYKFGTKNNWRRWAWNRLAPASKDDVVLYLAGERDLDRAVAIEKGFDPRNLIAIEQDPNVVASLRRRGVNCIHGDFQQVVRSWGGRNVSVVFGDFCSGIPKDFHITLGRMSASPCFADTVCAWNLMRGRESWHARSEQMTAFFQSEVFGKHRGEIVVNMHRGAFEYVCDAFVPRFWEREAQLLDLYNDCHKAQLHTYRSSSGQIFDSCCYVNWNVFGAIRFTAQRLKHQNTVDWIDEQIKVGVARSKSAEKYKGRIAAAMAIRTSRQSN